MNSDGPDAKEGSVPFNTKWIYKKVKMLYFCQSIWEKKKDNGFQASEDWLENF